MAEHVMSVKGRLPGTVMVSVRLSQIMSFRIRWGVWLMKAGARLMPVHTVITVTDPDKKDGCDGD